MTDARGSRRRLGHQDEPQQQAHAHEEGEKEN